jgi:hypothetical protein
MKSLLFLSKTPTIDKHASNSYCARGQIERGDRIAEVKNTRIDHKETFETVRDPMTDWIELYKSQK